MCARTCEVCVVGVTRRKRDAIGSPSDQGGRATFDETPRNHSSLSFA